MDLVWLPPVESDWEFMCRHEGSFETGWKTDVPADREPRGPRGLGVQGDSHTMRGRRTTCFSESDIFVAILTSATLVVGVAQAGAPKDDWPKINGELWINSDDLDISHTGTRKNDELLGGHGADRIHGGRGTDVIWGDHKATGNTTRQRDFVRAGCRRRLGLCQPRAQHDLRRRGRRHDPRLVRPRLRRLRPGQRRHPLRQPRSGPNVKRRNCETLSHKSAKDAIHDRDD